LPAGGLRHLARLPGPRLRRLLVEQDAVRGPLQVVELTRAQRPEESGQPEQAEEEGDRDQIDQHVHAASHPFVRRSRSALTVTAMDDADITAAAISGVT